MKYKLFIKRLKRLSILILITIKSMKPLLKNLYKYRLFISKKEKLNFNKIILKLYLLKRLINRLINY